MPAELARTGADLLERFERLQTALQPVLLEIRTFGRECDDATRAVREEALAIVGEEDRHAMNATDTGMAALLDAMTGWGALFDALTAAHVDADALLLDPLTGEVAE